MNLNKYKKPSWMENEDIKPYVFVRKENQSLQPGSLHEFEWFDHNYILKDPLKVSEARFGKAIMTLDNIAFDQQQMQTPPWVFFDCGIIPGVITGYAMKTEKLPLKIKKILKPDQREEWTPLSLFIAIPSVQNGTWMAHNLSSINSVLDSEEKFSKLGFFSKAFGLWYANIERVYGVTQWHSPALKLHPSFGEFQLITTFTKLHDYRNSVTYCCLVNPEEWVQILDNKLPQDQFLKKYQKIEMLDPKDEQAIRRIQKRLENDKTKLYLSGLEVLNKKIGDPLYIYKRRPKSSRKK